MPTMSVTEREIVSKTLLIKLYSANLHR